MQRLYDFRAVNAGDFPALKQMWQEIFGDSEKSVDNFFLKTAEVNNILAAFYGDEPVSALYLLDSTIRVGVCDYKAYYVYAVCTKCEHRGAGLMKKLLNMAYEKASHSGVSYLYLVPAEKSLFELYGKCGYKTGFYYKEVELKKNDFPQGDYTITQLTYDEFKKYRQGAGCTLATPCEKMFSSFYCPADDDIKVICVAGEGYGVAEKCDGGYIVHELFGDENAVAGCIFSVLGCDTITVKKPSASDGEPYGMYKAVGDAPEITNGFFGIPYGG